MVFPGETKNTRYGDALAAFLKRADVKDSIKQYAELLLGSHSTRKGATNAGAQGGLVAGVLMAVLLRGQWDKKGRAREDSSGNFLERAICAQSVCSCRRGAETHS